MRRRTAGQRRPLPRHAAVERPVARRDAGIAVNLGRAVDVADLRRAQFLGGDAYFLRRADHQPGAEARHPLAAKFGMPQDGAGDARQRIDGGDPVALDEADPLARLEARLQDQRGAVRQGRRQRVARAIGPEQGRRQQHPVVRREAHPLADVEAVLDDREMLQAHRLGARARPRGVEDKRVVAGAGAGARRERAARRGGAQRVVGDPAGPQIAAEHHDEAQPAAIRHQGGERGGKILAGEAIDRDHRLDLRVGQQKRQFVRLRPGAERYRHGAQRRNPEARFEPFGPVVDEDADAVAAADAVHPQRRRGPGRGLGQRRVGHGPLAADRRRPLGKALGLFAQELE